MWSNERFSIVSTTTVSMPDSFAGWSITLWKVVVGDLPEHAANTPPVAAAPVATSPARRRNVRRSTPALTGRHSTMPRPRVRCRAGAR